MGSRHQQNCPTPSLQKASDCFWPFHNEMEMPQLDGNCLFVWVRCFVVWILFKLWRIERLYKEIWKQIIVNIWFNLSVYVQVYSKTDIHIYVYHFFSTVWREQMLKFKHSSRWMLKVHNTHLKLPKLVNIQRPDQLACCLWHCRRSHTDFSLVLISLPKITSLKHIVIQSSTLTSIIRFVRYDIY